MKFAKEQRVTVPGSAARAVIIEAIEQVPGFPIYKLCWLDEQGTACTGVVGEGDLAWTNHDDLKQLAAVLAPAKSRRKR